MNCMTIKNTESKRIARIWRIIPLLLILLVAAQAWADSLPSGEKVIEDYLKAIGGRKALAKQHNSITKGSMVMSGMTLPLTSYSAEPNLAYFLMESAMTGKMESGCNGELAWDLSVMQGGSIKEGEELEIALLDATFNAPLFWKEHNVGAETMSIEEIDGKSCYKVVLTPKLGEPKTNFYDVESHLLLKTEAVRKSAMGEISVVTYLSDYRELAGTLTPFVTRSIFMGTQEMTMTIESLEYNTEIPEGIFDLPADIQALLGD
ncbi:MAG: outer membrane lipoprotein-sorting protein [bacterium]|nr:outer membrane lipoprotein-sorting protein [bacterium]